MESREVKVESIAVPLARAGASGFTSKWKEAPPPLLFWQERKVKGQGQTHVF